MNAGTIKALESVGVRIGVRVRWHRMPDANDDPIYQVAFCCRCSSPGPEQWPMVPLHHAGRCILVGQCRRCGIVTWCAWTGKTYTGPALLDGKPLQVAPTLSGSVPTT